MRRSDVGRGIRDVRYQMSVVRRGIRDVRNQITEIRRLPACRAKRGKEGWHRRDEQCEATSVTGWSKTDGRGQISDDRCQIADMRSWGEKTFIVCEMHFL